MTDAMQWLESCTPFLWNVAWKGTLLLAVAWAVDRLWLRRRLLGADMLWTATLLGLLALPLGAAALPRITLPVWPAPAAVDIPPMDAMPVPAASVSLNDAPLADEANAGAANEATPTAPVAPSRKASVLSFSWPSPSATAAAIVLLGCAALLGRLAWGVASMAKLVKRATPVREEACGETWLSALATRKEQLSVGRNVRLLASEETAIPFTTGWRRPAIVVPADVAASADEATIDATLLHELTHIARGDYPVHLAGKLVEVCYWWNPLAWLATARLYATRESICDGYCCWRMGDCERYGNALLALAGRLTRRRFGGVGLAMARGSRLGKRLESLPRLTLVDYAARRGARTAALSLAIAVSFIISSAALGYQSASEASVAEIIAALAEVEGSIQGLAGELHLDAKYRFEPPADHALDEKIENEPRSSNVTGDFTFDYRADGTGMIRASLIRTEFLPKGKESKRRELIVSLFDGKRGKLINADLTEDGMEISTQVRYPTNFLQVHIDPRNLATRHVRESISELLAQGNAKIVGSEAVDGRPTVIVEVDPKRVRDDYIYQQRFWIDVERRVAVRRESNVQRGEGMPWGLHYRVACQDYKEVKPGIWLPKQAHIWNYHVTTEGQDYLVSEDRVDGATWKVNESLEKISIDDDSSGGGHLDDENETADAAKKRENKRLSNEQILGELKIVVVDEAGKPMPGVDVFQNHVHHLPGAPADSKQMNIKNQHYATDAAGEAKITWEGKSADLRIWVRHPGHVPLHAMWSTEFQADGSEIPEEFRFVLKRGTTIGGVVQDERGRPIAGAKVEVHNIRALSHAMIPAGGTRAGIRPVPVTGLAEGEAAIVTDGEGRWQATNIPSDEELDISKVAKEMLLPPGAAYPQRLRISHDDFAPYEGNRDRTLEEAPSLAALRSGEAVVVLKAKEDSGQDVSGETGALNRASPPTEEGVDSKEYPNPPKLAYLAWELPPSKNGSQLSRAWNVRGEETGEPLSVGTFEYNGKTHKPRAWNWADDTLTLHAHPLVLWFEDGAPFEYRPTIVAVVDADGEKHWQGTALSRRWEKRLVSVAAPEKPFVWPEKVNLLIKYPIEATQTIKELTAFSDQPTKVAEGVDWMGRVEADGRFASTLILWRKPQDEDLTSYGATLIAKDGSRISNDAGGVVRTFDDRQERVEWYADLQPEEIARVNIRRQRRATAAIEGVPIRLDMLPRE